MGLVDPDVKELNAADAGTAAAEVAKIAEWWSPSMQCSKGVTYPDANGLKDLMEATDEQVIALKDGSGLVTYRPAYGKIQWLLADPADFVAIAEQLCSAVKDAQKEAPWGVIEINETRNFYLSGQFRLLMHDELSKGHVALRYQEGQIIIYTGA